MSTASRKAVIVVDDEIPYCELLSKLLGEHLGRPVITFSNPEKALAALPELDVAVVVTDYYMPAMTGIQFIRRAIPLLPQVPFIIITGHPLRLSDENLQNLREVKAVLPKPFNWRRLSQLVARHWPDPSTRPEMVSQALG